MRLKIRLESTEVEETKPRKSLMPSSSSSLPPSLPLLLTVPDTARLMSVAETSVREFVYATELDGRWIGTRILVTSESVVDFIARQPRVGHTPSDEHLFEPRPASTPKKRSVQTRSD
ncbi:hypothetical protein [Sabulicella glaciei]|uniref:Helix-turn-helix domain-containing protein n=1 Tax=Sabulicella glaciei TaxID=2984948 RepID=A0ABT3NU88_9PROT|nr:hypothetical protein [Roseococcus sp. MDT2-1-1]MCW8085727.1 hypothetical protein [Roseococcus sp. MDT2-1-1]